MGWLLPLIGVFTLLGAGFGAEYAWDRHPPIGFTIPVPLWHPRIALPPSLAEQRDVALKAKRLAEEASLLCRATLTMQNLSIAREEALGKAALAETTQRLQREASQVASLRARAAELGAYHPAGPDACSRWEDGDRMVQMMLRGG